MKIYRADGHIETVTIIGRKVTLKELQEAVGGYIEPVPGTHGRAYCDEDGRIKGRTLNAKASIRFEQWLVGDVVELEPGDEQ